MEKYKKVKKCRACLGESFTVWFSLGMQPLANNLLKNESEFKDEKKYPLTLIKCTNCKLVQLSHVVHPDLLFKNYLYHSSTSEVFRDHFEKLAVQLFAMDKLKKNDLVVDIGSNDGILLKPFKKEGARVLGVEPATEIAGKANGEGIETINGYFNLELAAKISKDYGTAKLITATNVFAHIDDLDSILNGVKYLLAHDGIFMLEVAYLPEMLNQRTFDLIYHEHLSYWHLYPLSVLLDRKNMTFEEVQFIPTHGGSMRVFISNKISDKGYVELPSEKNLTNSFHFYKFPKMLEENKINTMSLLNKYKRQNKRIIGYGAPAKATTITNYYGITSDYIDFILEDSSAKWNMYLPGTHIKIKPYNRNILPGFADFVFIFAWNFADSIVEKCRADGYKGSFIVPFPHVRII